MNGTFDHWQLALIQRQEVTQDSNHRPDFHDFFLANDNMVLKKRFKYMPIFACIDYSCGQRTRQQFRSDVWNSDFGALEKKNQHILLFACINWNSAWSVEETWFDSSEIF